MQLPCLTYLHLALFQTIYTVSISLLEIGDIYTIFWKAARTSGSLDIFSYNGEDRNESMSSLGRVGSSVAMRCVVREIVRLHILVIPAWDSTRREQRSVVESMDCISMMVSNKE